jgi:hypothetical protein
LYREFPTTSESVKRHPVIVTPVTERDVAAWLDTLFARELPTLRQFRQPQ